MSSTSDLQREIVAAVWAGDSNRVKLLLGVEPGLVHVRDPFGRTLLEISANQVYDRQPQFREIVIQLVEAGAACDIFTAARAGMDGLVTHLLASSPGLAHAVDTRGRSALQRAALINGECEACDHVVDELIRQDVEVDGFTACVFVNTAIVAREVSRNHIFVDTYLQGGTPLLWCTRPRRNRENAPIVAATLLNAGAALDVRDTESDENTPLHHAASWADQKELVRILLMAGADTELRNADGKTAYDLAREHKHAGCAQLLGNAEAQSFRLAKASKGNGTKSSNDGGLEPRMAASPVE